MNGLANVEASRRQKLLNCAAWNEEQARKAAKAGDAQRAGRLAKQAEGLRHQANPDYMDEPFYKQVSSDRW